MRFLNIWVKIFTTFLVPTLSNGQLSTNPFYLTDGQNGVKSIPYRATDQCMPKMEAKHGKTYGLSFRLHSQGEHCDDGLLICYPGMLMRHYSTGIGSSAFKVKGTFQVGNEKNGSVFPKMRGFFGGKMTVTDTERLRAWDKLILITMFFFTEKKPFIDNESNLQNQFQKQFLNGAFLREHTGLWMLGLDVLPSMEKENVKLFIARNCSCSMEAWTFPIVLPGELPAKIVIKAITDDKLNNITVELLHGDEMDKDGNVLMKITIGTTDDLTVILPGTADPPNVIKGIRLHHKGHIMRLEIYLLEYCYAISLNGNRLGGLFWPKHWWNRKEVKSIKLSGQMLLLVGPRVDALVSNEFKNISLPPVELSLPLNFNGVGEPAIVINAINVINIMVELLHEDATGKDGDVLMKITIGKTDDLKVMLLGTTPIVFNGRRLPNGSSKILLKIYLLEYCYAISLNGNRLGGLFWPKHWWNRKEVKSIKLNGQMLLLEDPRVEYNKKSHPPVSLPFFWPIDAFREHSTFLFRVQLLNPSKGFKIIFSNNSTFDGITDQTAFVVQVADLKRVELGVYYGGKAHPEQANRKDLSFTPGDVYEFFISVSKSFYGILLNGENLFENYTNSMPFCDIKFVRVEGDAVVLEEPELHVPPVEKVYAHALNNTLLNYGDKIILNCTLNRIGKIMKIYLQNKDERCSKNYSDVAVLMLEISSLEKPICSHHLHKEKAAGISTENVTRSKHQFLIHPFTETTVVEILMGEDGFYGKTMDRWWYKLCPYYNPKNINISTMPIPPWTIDHITVNSPPFDTLQIWVEKASSNAEELLSMFGRNQVPWKRINFTQVIKKEGVDSVNYSVFVNITLEGGLKPNSEVRINFFNEALEFHDLFGTTLLRVTLRKNTLSFNSFVNQNKTWSEPEQNNNLEKLLPPNLYFKIDVHETDGKAEFAVTLNGQDKDVDQKVLKYKCPDNVHVPGIQYITVEHENGTLAAGSAELEVRCSSEVTCVNKQ
uniref:Galectin domain-containing protein n=1 Tax=Globodera rostochiensis TaxID=31243 RepID=A0A914H4V9_GLORO